MVKVKIILFVMILVSPLLVYGGSKNVEIEIPQDGLIPETRVIKYMPQMGLTIPDTVLSINTAEKDMIFLCESSIICLFPIPDETERLNSILNGNLNINNLKEDKWIKYMLKCDSIYCSIKGEIGIHAKSIKVLEAVKNGAKRPQSLQGVYIEKNGFRIIIWAKEEVMSEIICMICDTFKIKDLNTTLIKLLLQIEKVNRSRVLSEELYLMYYPT